MSELRYLNIKNFNLLKADYYQCNVFCANTYEFAIIYNSSQILYDVKSQMDNNNWNKSDCALMKC